MKKHILTLIVCLMATRAFAGSLLIEGFEYANHDMMPPIGWTSADSSWRCGYLEKDHNRMPHNGNWYAFSDAEDSWMYMPLYFLQSMRYRFTLWAITDGSFQFEIWAGSSPNPDDMHTCFYTTTLDKDVYDKVSAYVESVPANCQYFGFHAVALNGASHLTIDDVEIDMVEQYTFIADPITGDTAMYPGTQGVFHFRVENTGYDGLSITAHPSNEYFTGFTCECNGSTGMTFHVDAGQVVEVTMTATLRPEIEPGTVSWLDIQMTIPCNCNTALVTFWVTPLDITQTAENEALDISVYPNPAVDFVTVEGEGIQQITMFDLTGRMIKSVPVESNLTRISLDGLQKGSYIIIAEGKEGMVRRGVIKR